MAKGTATIIAAGYMIATAAVSYVYAASQIPSMSEMDSASYKVAGTGAYEVTPMMRNWGVNSHEFRAPSSPDYPCCGYIYSDTP